MISQSCVTEYAPDESFTDIKMVVNAEIEAQSHAQFIHLGKSFSNYASETMLSEELNVEIYRDGNTVPFYLNALGDTAELWYFPEDLSFMPGELYFLNIDASKLGLGLIRSESRVPYPIDIFESSVNYDGNNDLLDIEIKLDKQAQNDAYLHFEFFFA
jgi:hypothetical protein